MNRITTVAAALAGLVLPAVAQDLPSSVVQGKEQFGERVLVRLQGPWEVTWDPDNFLWVTERTAGKIDWIDPKTGAIKTAITLPEGNVPADRMA